MAWRPHPRMARTDPTNPSGWATCQKSGMVGNAKNLVAQMEWRGMRVMPTGILAYAPYIDKPQRQLGANIMPPDPTTLTNARPEQYPVDENWPRLTQKGQPRYLQNSRVARMLQYTVYFNTTTNF
jgi:hypothetical protein